MAEQAVTVSGLTKTYGEAAALDDVSFSVEEGSACALVGPNGAGKTTLISVLLGLISQDSGAATILGRDAGSLESRRDIGYLPDVPSLPGWMRAEEVLSLSLDLAAKGSRSSVAPLLRAVGLSHVRRPVRTYSRGMKQRLGLAQALVTSPRLLILDEPTSALDPAGQQLFHSLVQSLAGRATVLYSTHSLNEAERVCDSAIIIDQGRLVRHASMEELISGGQGLHLEVAGRARGLVDELERSNWVTAVAAQEQGGRSRISITVTDMEKASQRISGVLSASGAALHSLRPRTLEEIFLDLTGGQA